jgi:hypothetical protein
MTTDQEWGPLPGQFVPWLESQAHRNDTIGDFARLVQADYWHPLSEASAALWAVETWLEHTYGSFPDGWLPAIKEFMLSQPSFRRKRSQLATLLQSEIALNLRKTAANHFRMMEEAKWDQLCTLYGLRDFLKANTDCKPEIYRDNEFLDSLALDCWIADGRSLNDSMDYTCNDCTNEETWPPGVVEICCRQCGATMYPTA